MQGERRLKDVVGLHLLQRLAQYIEPPSALDLLLLALVKRGRPNAARCEVAHCPRERREHLLYRLPSSRISGRKDLAFQLRFETGTDGGQELLPGLVVEH